MIGWILVGAGLPSALTALFFAARITLRGEAHEE